LSIRPIVLIGQISYALYLWNTPARWLVDGIVIGQGISPHPALILMAKITVTLLMAVVSWRLVEHPLSRYRDRMNRRPASAL
jgi:peptidoglycan/LPS O-acetylase OafA/YrhL